MAKENENKKLKALVVRMQTGKAGNGANNKIDRSSVASASVKLNDRQFKNLNQKLLESIVQMNSKNPSSFGSESEKS